MDGRKVRHASDVGRVGDVGHQEVGVPVGMCWYEYCVE